MNRILIFSIQQDYSTNQVVKLLIRKGVKILRLNGDCSDYKFYESDKTGIYFKNTKNGYIENLLQYDACWWRRTGIRLKHLHYDKNLTIKDAPFTNDYIRSECSALQEYIFNRIYKNVKVNLGCPLYNLNRLIVMEYANEIGLKIPEHKVITNSIQLNNTQKKYNGCVSKAISNGIYETYNGNRYYTYTEKIESICCNKKINSFLFPSLVSSLIEKQIEIRSFYIDGQLYSMAIFSQNEKKSQIDCRKGEMRMRIPYKLPKDIENKLIKLYKQLNLNTGSADLIVDKNGDYIFLEINPVGQFGMTSEPCNYNLEQKIVDYLIK